MREMHWSWHDLQQAPSYVVEQIVSLLEVEREAATLKNTGT